MRTSLTLDDELARRVRELAAERGCSATAIVQEALRVLLADLDSRRECAALPAGSERGGPRAGIDLHDNEALRARLDAAEGLDALP